MVIDYSKEVREVAAALRAYHEIEHRSNTSRINYMRGLAEEDFLRLYSKDLAIGELLRGLLHAGIQIKPLVPFESSEGSYDERKRTVKEGSAKAIFDNNDLKNYVERLDKLFKESRQKFKMAQALGGTIVDSADTAVVDGVETLVQVATPNRKHLVVWIDIKAVTSTPDRTYDTYIPSFGFYDFKKERITGF
ncbi:MAG TPA: hypothetical protein VJC07_01170, partial [Candidatus Nanoarchaeia archaeon]|nr:hypothetical protein [Candidatus Nanoarchaeia archaeon]